MDNVEKMKVSNMNFEFGKKYIIEYVSPDIDTLSPSICKEENKTITFFGSGNIEGEEFVFWFIDEDSNFRAFKESWIKEGLVKLIPVGNKKIDRDLNNKIRSALKEFTNKIDFSKVQPL